MIRRYLHYYVIFFYLQNCNVTLVVLFFFPCSAYGCSFQGTLPLPLLRDIGPAYFWLKKNTWFTVKNKGFKNILKGFCLLLLYDKIFSNLVLFKYNYFNDKKCIKYRYLKLFIFLSIKFYIIQLRIILIMN